MYNYSLPNCLIVEGFSIKHRIRSVLKEIFNLHFITMRQDIVSMVRNENIDCIIFYLDKGIDTILKQTHLINQNFQELPMVGIVESNIKIDTIRKCGELGVDYVIDSHSLTNLKDTVFGLINKYSARVKLSNFKIDENTGSVLLQRSLKIIEENYIDLMGTGEIANQLGVNESTISREFKKNNIAGPKRLLLYFKIKHATNLMRNQGLSLKEIASQSGFSSEQRFYECFRNVFDKTPNEYRTGAVEA